MTRHRQLMLFFGVVLLLSIGLGIHEPILNNFLDQTFHISATTRGWLEFPREFPGLAVVLMAGILSALAVTHVGVTASIIFMVGLGGMGLFGDRDFRLTVLLMMVSSAGMHLLMPVQSAITLALSDPAKRGRRMGQMGTVTTVGMLIGAGSVRLFFDDATNPFGHWFLFACLAVGVAGIVYVSMHLPELHQPRARFVFRKEYRLYYILEFLFGARKQIFITFGYWVLVRIYNEPTTGIAQLVLIAAVIGLAFKPLTGWAIDHFGERAVLIADGLILSVVCVGYGYAQWFTGGDVETAHQIARVCFVLDSLLFTLGTGRSVYVSRLTPSKQELTSTLAMGISINHIASMTLPALAGDMWDRFGFESLFAAAAILALLIAAVATRVPGKHAWTKKGEA